MNFLPQPIRSTKRLIALAIWLIFSLSLAVWLYIFSSSQIEQLASMVPNLADTLNRYHRMLLWEAGTLFTCLLGGGLVIAYYIYRDVQQSNNLRTFFLSLSHELKTAIASLQLQLEYITTDQSNADQTSNLKKLSTDIARLTFQLENSLYLADTGEGQLLPQTIKLSDALESLAIRLPDLKLNLPSEPVTFLADRRALDSILLNIGYNALKHGQATELNITALLKDNFWQINFHDNGQGYRGDRNILGQFMQRTESSSGSCIGLYLAKKLACRLGGSLCFPDTRSGFQVELNLPKVSLH